MWITSLLGVAGLTTMFAVGPTVRPAAEKLSEMVSASLSARLVKVATPPITVTDVVPSSGPAPLASEAVIMVALSAVMIFPNWSSS